MLFLNYSLWSQFCKLNFCISFYLDNQDSDKSEEWISSDESSSQQSKKQHEDARDKKRHQCTTCGYSSNRQDAFKRHVVTLTAEKPYVCEICNKEFLRRCHIRVHESQIVKNHSCEKCDKKYDSSSSLRRHVRTAHDKRLDHKCPVCNAEFAQASVLARHLKTHTRARDYKCEKCGKVYTREYNLKVHEKTHTEERP